MYFSIIYEPSKPDNEERSAELFKQFAEEVGKYYTIILLLLICFKPVCTCIHIDIDIMYLYILSTKRA